MIMSLAGLPPASDLQVQRNCTEQMLSRRPHGRAEFADCVNVVQRAGYPARFRITPVPRHTGIAREGDTRAQQHSCWQQ